MASVNTVLGSVDSADLDFTLSHEHIVLSAAGMRQTYPEFGADRQSIIDAGVAALKEAYDEGVRTIIDVTTFDLGRDIDPGYEWGTSKGLTHGTWLVAVVADSPPRVGVRGGVLSATTRGIKKAGGVIGVILGGRDGKSFGGVQVTEVAKGGPAEKAGVKKNDVIYAIDGKEVFERAKMIEIVKSNDPGTTITVSVKRGEDKKDIKVTLGYRNLVFAEMKSRNDRMGGTVSVRRTGFERIIQHEISLGKSDMGGPLFDLEGKLVGINIAKANRVEFFAIPAEDIRQVLEDKAEEIAKARGK